MALAEGPARYPCSPVAWLGLPDLCNWATGAASGEEEEKSTTTLAGACCSMPLPAAAAVLRPLAD